MNALRLLAVGLGLALMIGEGFRSWGAGRPIAAWIDDMALGVLFVVSAAFLHKETPAGRAFFSGVWGMSVGGLYLSFASKLFEPQLQTAGNLALPLLMFLVGAAFAIALAGFGASLVIPFKTE